MIIRCCGYPRRCREEDRLISNRCHRSFGIDYLVMFVAKSLEYSDNC